MKSDYQLKYSLGRIDIDDTSNVIDSGQRKWGESVCAIFRMGVNIFDEGTNRYRIEKHLFRDKSLFTHAPLRKDQHWYHDHCSASGTAFLVGDKKTLLTAGHYFEGDDSFIEEARFIFNFREGGAADKVFFAKEEVYEAIDIQVDPNDFAIITLNDDVLGPDPFSLSSTDIRKKDPSTKLYSIGHPFGLPQQVATKGHIFPNDTGSSPTIPTSFDSFGGNSGAPVISYVEDQPKSHLVEAIVLYQTTGGDTFDVLDGETIFVENPTDGIASTQCFPIQSIIPKIP